MTVEKLGGDGGGTCTWILSKHPHSATDPVSGFPSHQGTQRTHMQVKSGGLGPSLVSRVSLCPLVLRPPQMCFRRSNCLGMDFRGYRGEHPEAVGPYLALQRSEPLVPHSTEANGG